MATNLKFLGRMFHSIPGRLTPAEIWERKKKLARAFEAHRRQTLEREMEEDLKKLASCLKARRTTCTEPGRSDAVSVRDSGADGAVATLEKCPQITGAA